MTTAAGLSLSGVDIAEYHVVYRDHVVPLLERLRSSEALESAVARRPRQVEP